MPTHEHLVRCGGLERSAKSAKTLDLNLHDPNKNVALKIEDIDALLGANIPDELVDLLEIAAYVYAADSAVGRGAKTDSGLGARWRRRFRFAIPVRRPELWGSPAVIEALVDTLNFLSEDDFTFEFERLERPPRAATYLDLRSPADLVPDDVMLFSGGLDSLAGAVEALAAHGRKVALVSHRSVPKVASVQRALVDDLRKKFGAKRVSHIPVWMNLIGGVNRESTHRTRSFLFTALAAVTARLFGLDRFSFFENGIVSLNLPPVAQVVGSRATRSTHPQALAGFRRLLSAVRGQPFEVDNPYTWLTKAQVVERIAANGCADLIRYSRSCTRVRDRTILNPHCGQCSQCIDRRFAVLAAGQADADPSDAYEVDLFTGARPAGPDREMALAYVRMASEINTIDELAFFERYGEVSRIIRHSSETPDVVAGRVLDLYRRHASGVCSVFDAATVSHRTALRERALPPDCLLSLVIGLESGSPPHATPVSITEPTRAPASKLRIAIAEDGATVTFNGWGDLEGADAELIVALAGPFEQAVNEKRAPENYPFLKWQVLGPLLNVAGDERVRKRVERCRDSIERLATAAGDRPPELSAVIENLPWHGYRLNPDGVRLIAATELRNMHHSAADKTERPRSTPKTNKK